MRVEESTIIQANRKEVFSFLCDVENRPKIIPLLEKVILINSDELSLGTKYIEVSSIAGRRIETTYMVSVFEENEQISVVSVKSIFPIRVDMTLRSTDEGTRVDIELEAKLKGIYALGESFIKLIVKRQTFEILMNIQKEVEKRASR